MNQEPEAKDVLTKPPSGVETPSDGASNPPSAAATVTKPSSDVDKTDKCEGRSDGDGGGSGSSTPVVSSPPPLVRAPAVGGGARSVVPVRHILPQIPTMSHSRLAVSKASRKESQTVTPEKKPILNIVSQAELEKPSPPKTKPSEDEAKDSSTKETPTTETSEKNEEDKEKVVPKVKDDKTELPEAPPGEENKPEVKAEAEVTDSSATSDEKMETDDNTDQTKEDKEKSETEEKSKSTSLELPAQSKLNTESTGPDPDNQSESGMKSESSTNDSITAESDAKESREPKSSANKSGVTDTGATENTEAPSTPERTKRDASTDSAHPPDTMPTPPSEEASPKVSAQSPPPPTMSPPTPIKLKIKRNTGAGLTSTVTLGEEGKDGASIEVQGQQGKKGRRSSAGSAKRQTKTKALLKGKRLSRRQSQKEAEEEETEIDEPEVEGAAVALPEVQPKERKFIEPEAPSEEALKSAIIDPSLEPTYTPGDMLWAKVGGHPYWACMVSHDPFDNLFYKQREKKKAFGASQILFMYHVQFFGAEAERAWVAESTVMPYEGVNAFHEYCRVMMTQKDKRNKSKYEIKSGRRRAWDIAVVSAEDAFSMPKEKRRKEYTFTYYLNGGENKDDNKDTNKDVLPNGAIQRKRKHDKEQPEEPLLDSRPARKKRRQASILDYTEQARFTVFCQKRRKSVADEFPDYDEEQVESLLAEQWEKMPVDDRMKFIPMGSDVQNLSGLIKAKSPERSSSRESRHFARESRSSRESRAQSRESRDTPRESRALSSESRRRQLTAAATLASQHGRNVLPLGVKVRVIEAVDSGKSNRQVAALFNCGRTQVASIVGNRAAIMKAFDEGRNPNTKYLDAKRPSDPESRNRRSLKRGEDDTEETEEEEESEPKKTRKSTQAAEAMDLDSILDSVASGAGELPTYPPFSQDKAKSRRKRSLAAGGNEDTASETTSQSGDDVAARHKKYDFTGCDLYGDLPLDYELEFLKLCSTGPRSKESVCLVCEEAGDLIQCEGACEGTFHHACLALSRKPSGAWKCETCKSGKHPCFVCKSSEGEVKQCKVAHCGKFYHIDCISTYPHARIENNSIYCPLHVCATCITDNPKNPKCSKGRFFKCIRCPTAYHVGEFCVAAGSMQLEGHNIVCSRHFQPVRTQSHHQHINVSWCFLCSKGGTLLCCESCPAAYHVECLDLESFPEGSFFCKDCKVGRRPLYGDIVWVKLGSYRWWPGEICHPTNVPLNIQDKSHQVGEFPIRFFGSHDYFWTHQARVFMFQEGDFSSKACTSGSSLVKQFTKGVREATAAYRMWEKVKAVKEEQLERKSATKPRPYRHIKVNLPVGDVVVYKPDLSSMPRCDCKPDSDPPPCSDESKCMNRMLMYECHPQLCHAGDQCQNQRFQRREYPKSEIFKTAFGWGLKSLAEIKKGQFVHEYVGELIDDEECKRRLKLQHDNDVDDFYMLTLDRGRIIDAGPKGNLCRFLNHCCDPNCETTKWNVNGDIRVGLFATRDIKPGDELTFNYNLDCLGNDKKKCQCGAVNCSGYLGVPPKNSDGKDRDKKKKKKKKKRRQDQRNKVSEDECYRCGEGGELVMCDRSWCPKAYHLECLNLQKSPNGKWECPWHHCDVCGKGAVKLCSECPNSFCKTHIEENIYDIGDGKLLCSDHDELLGAIDSSCITTPVVGPNDGRITSSSASSAASTPHSVSDNEGNDSGAEHLVIDESATAGSSAGSKGESGSGRGSEAETSKMAQNDVKSDVAGVKSDVTGDIKESDGSSGGVKVESDTTTKSPSGGDKKKNRTRKSLDALRHGGKSKSRSSPAARSKSRKSDTANIVPKVEPSGKTEESNNNDSKSTEDPPSAANKVDKTPAGSKRKSEPSKKRRRSASIGGAASKKRRRSSKNGECSAENGQQQSEVPSGGESGTKPPQNAPLAAISAAPAQDNSTDDEGNLVIDIP